MRTPTLVGLTIAVAAVLACGDSQGPDGGSGGPPAAVLLKDVDITSLPSPYYHFEYGPLGQIARVSFASGLLIYDVTYQNGRIAQLRNITPGNRDHLQYFYDPAGRVETVNYVHSTGIVFARVRLTYDGDRLTRLDRERDLGLGVGFAIEKTMSFSYYGDGNVEEIVEHHPALNGQPEFTLVYRFEQYDDDINVDGFGLIHNEFFDHVVLLPDVQLQKGNPARETLTGGGTDYRFDFTYTYDENKRPLTQQGTATILTGPDAGRVVPLSTTYSYY